jgi:hypothetical protein
MNFFGNEDLSKDLGTFQKPFLKFENYKVKLFKTLKL